MNGSKFFLSNHSSAANIVIPSNTTLAGINVPRRRFLPVKTCSDLLIIMSNLYEMKHGQLEMSHLRQFPTVPIVQLSGSHFKKVRGHSSRCLMFQSRSQSLRNPDPAKRAKGSNKRIAVSGNEIDNVQDLYYPGCRRLFMRSFLLRSSLYKHCSMGLVKSNCCSVLVFLPITRQEELIG